MFWVLYIVVRYVRGYTDYTCIQINIPLPCVCLSPEGSRCALVQTSEDARIPPVLNYASKLKLCWNHPVDHAKIRT